MIKEKLMGFLTDGAAGEVAVACEDSVRKLWTRALVRLQHLINQDHPGFDSTALYSSE